MTSQSHTSVVETATAPLHIHDDGVGDGDRTFVIQHRMSFQQVQRCTAHMKQVRVLPASATTHSSRGRINLMTSSKAHCVTKSVSAWPKLWSLVLSSRFNNAEYVITASHTCKITTYRVQLRLQWVHRHSLDSITFSGDHVQRHTALTAVSCSILSSQMMCCLVSTSVGPTTQPLLTASHVPGQERPTAYSTDVSCGTPASEMMCNVMSSEWTDANLQRHVPSSECNCNGSPASRVQAES